VGITAIPKEPLFPFQRTIQLSKMALSKKLKATTALKNTLSSHKFPLHGAEF